MDLTVCFSSYWSKYCRDLLYEEEGLEEFDFISVIFQNDYKERSTTLSLGLLGFNFHIHLTWSE